APASKNRKEKTVNLGDPGSLQRLRRAENAFRLPRGVLQQPGFSRYQGSAMTTPSLGLFPARLVVFILFLAPAIVAAQTSPPWDNSDQEMPPPSPAGYDRPLGDKKQSRPVVMARHGTPATRHPPAPPAGRDVLQPRGHAA